MEERTIAKKKPASKKTSASKKKKASSAASFRLSKEEKTLILNYRKCNAVEKEVIKAVTEKAGTSDLGSLLKLLGK